MDQLVLKSYAKINLGLDVGAKRPEDGYHYVNTIMVPITLCDHITMRSESNLQVVTRPDVAGPAESNLAYRAASLLKEATGYAGGAHILVEKRIPVAGGLAGGSTNGAAVLRGLNRLWGTGLSDEELTRLAIRLGSDVPFFIREVPARVEGIGEQITPIRVKRPLWFVLATPPVAKSTGNVFRLFDEMPEVNHPDIPAMEAALAAGDLGAIGSHLGNVFEPVMIPRHPEIAALKASMLEGGALGTLMSGAGPTVFGLVADEAAGRRLVESLRSIRAQTFLVTSVGGGDHGS